MHPRLSSTNLEIYPRSKVTGQGVEYGLAQTPHGLRLVLLAPNPSTTLEAFEGEGSEFGQRTLLVGPRSARNASALRAQLPWLRPQVLGTRTSAGMGDRMGIATPGHVRAVRAVNSKIMPVFAQQSIREMTRTGRNPQQVMDDATWGVFEEGWQEGVGADADHLKTFADIDSCLDAGFTLFTFDPGSHVDNDAHMDDLGILNEKAGRLPANMQLDETGLLGKSFDIEGFCLTLDKLNLLRALAKYGKAVAHVASMYEYLQHRAGGRPYEIEISMDETELPTTPAEHIYVASELKRLGVSWVSFAPRFVGRFEKGVDYIGEIKAFEANLAIHAAIARQLGPYKLSLHSGSDKFSIYPLFMQMTQGVAHLKTAGTSYLEGLRTITALDQELIQEIYAFARGCFERDRHSYLISAQLAHAPAPQEVTDWPGLLNQFDAREILHVTFGSVLTEKDEKGHRRFYDRIMYLLGTHREQYFSNLENHFRHHLELFSING